MKRDLAAKIKEADAALATEKAKTAAVRAANDKMVDDAQRAVDRLSKAIAKAEAAKGSK